MRQDNEQAFSCLIDRYQPVLFRHLLRRTQSPVDAQEILQDIFIAFWNKRQTIICEETIYPYLFQAAKYEIIDWYVRSQRSIRREELLLSSEPAVDFPAEDVLMARELEQLLEIEIEKMPGMMKAVFKLTRNELLSIKETAQRLSVSEQTVKNNISFALKRLRYVLKREHYVIISAIVFARLR